MQDQKQAKLSRTYALLRLLEGAVFLIGIRFDLISVRQKSGREDDDRSRVRKVGDRIMSAVSRKVRRRLQWELADMFDGRVNKRLAKAVVDDDVARMDRLLARGADLSSTGMDGMPLVELAMLSNSKRAFEKLLAAGFDTAQRDTHGRAALHDALRESDPWYMEMLLRYGADPDLKMERLETPPLMEAGMGDAQFRMLLAAGADPNARDESDRTPLMGAARLGRYDRVLELLESGADPLSKSCAGFTFQLSLHSPYPEEWLTPEVQGQLQRIREWLTSHGVALEPVPDHILSSRAEADRPLAVGYVFVDGAWQASFQINPLGFSQVQDFGRTVDAVLAELQAKGIGARIDQNNLTISDPAWDLPAWEEYRTG